MELGIFLFSEYYSKRKPPPYCSAVERNEKAPWIETSGNIAQFPLQFFPHVAALIVSRISKRLSFAKLCRIAFVAFLPSHGKIFHDVWNV